MKRTMVGALAAAALVTAAGVGIAQAHGRSPAPTQHAATKVAVGHASISQTPPRPAAPAVVASARPAPVKVTPVKVAPTPASVPGSTWLAISAAVKRSPLTSDVPPKDYRVVDIHVSQVDPAWAGAMIEPTVELDPAAVLLHSSRGHWKVADLGTARVGCGIAPTPVLEELRFFGAAVHC